MAYHEKNKICGIYKITNPVGHIYIGRSTNIKGRWSGYRGLYCKDQIKLYRSFLKYGVENHTFEIQEICSRDTYKERETYWKLYFNSVENGLNCTLIDIGDGSHY